MRPLIIQCGEGKLDGEHRVIDLYTGPLWSSVRAVVAELGGETTEKLGQRRDDC